MSSAFSFRDAFEERTRPRRVVNSCSDLVYPLFLSLEECANDTWYSMADCVLQTGTVCSFVHLLSLSSLPFSQLTFLLLVFFFFFAQSLHPHWLRLALPGRLRSKTPRRRSWKEENASFDAQARSSRRLNSNQPSPSFVKNAYLTLLSPHTLPPSFPLPGLRFPPFRAGLALLPFFSSLP